MHSAHKLFFLRVNFRRDFQAQAVQADEAGGVVLVAGLGRAGFHRGNHSGRAARVTLFSVPWLRFFLPDQCKSPAGLLVSPVRAVVVADRESA